MRLHDVPKTVLSTLNILPCLIDLTNLQVLSRPWFYMLPSLSNSLLEKTVRPQIVPTLFFDGLS